MILDARKRGVAMARMGEDAPHEPGTERPDGDDVAPEIQAVIIRLQEDLRGIAPDRLYTPEEAAALLAIQSERAVKTLGEIPKRLLPIVPVGPNGGLKRYWGRDLIGYIQAVRKAK